MIGIEPNCERLYLHKDNENEIYVNNSRNLKQHQIDSLRFLYRQFVKKKNGAVLNFPAGSGKSLVVTLFLNAVSSQLKERVLILCVDDEEIDHWKQLFLTWTDYKNDDIAVESSNPRLKKKIFLKKAEDLTSYFRCHWSVVVIKDEHICKTLQKVVLEADLKIWITSTDIKKDISLLLFIYNWMFSKSNININEIISNQLESDNKMVSSIILDTVLEDFVIRENKLQVIKDTKNSEILKIYKDNNKKGTTRKNKDATGNKIKRSKRNIDEEQIEQTNLQHVSNIYTDIKEEPGISGNYMDIEDKADIDEVREEKAGVDEVREEEACIDEVREEKAGVDEVREEEACIDEVREEKACIDEVREEKAGMNEVREEKAGVDEVREEKAGVDEVREEKAGVDEVREEKAGIDEVREEKPENSGNLKDIEIKPSCIHDIDVKIDTIKSDSFNLLQNNQNTIKIGKNTEETLDFQPAVNDIVVSENVVQCVDENSTESLDFGEENLNSTKILDFGSKQKSNSSETLDFGGDGNLNSTKILDFGDGVDEKLNSTESLDFGDDTEIISDNVLYIDKISNYKDNISRIDKENDIKIDLDTNSVATEKSEMNCNLDLKMSELEERTMKKFKGSLLDSLF